MDPAPRDTASMCWIVAAIALATSQIVRIAHLLSIRVGQAELFICMCCCFGLLALGIYVALLFTVEPSPLSCTIRPVVLCLGAVATSTSLALYSLRFWLWATSVEEDYEPVRMHRLVGEFCTAIGVSGSILACWLASDGSPEYVDGPANVTLCDDGGGSSSSSSSSSSSGRPECTWGSLVYPGIICALHSCFLIYALQCMAAARESLAARQEKGQLVWRRFSDHHGSWSSWRLLRAIEGFLILSMLFPYAMALGPSASNSLQAAICMAVAMLVSFSLVPAEDPHALASIGPAGQRLVFASTGEILLRVRVPDDPSSSHEHFDYLMFLSHKWDSTSLHGGQDAAALIKLNLEGLLDEAKVWLDVDNLEGSISRKNLGRQVRSSFAFVLFLTIGYFRSQNCLVELEAAAKKQKPLILVVESDAHHNAVSVETHRASCPRELREYVFGPPHAPRRVIQWRRDRPFQLLAMRLIVQELLTHHPDYAVGAEHGGAESSKASVSNTELYHPSEQVRRPVYLHHETVLFVTQANSVPDDVLEELVRVLDDKALDETMIAPGGTGVIRAHWSNPLREYTRTRGETEETAAKTAWRRGMEIQAHERPESGGCSLEIATGAWQRVFPRGIGRPRTMSFRARNMGAYSGKALQILGSTRNLAQRSVYNSSPSPQSASTARTHTTSLPAMRSDGKAVRMLVCLRDGCWGDAADEDGGVLAEAVRAAMRAGVPILIIHETSPERGGHQTFGDLMAQVPADLKAAGFLDTLSLSLLDGEYYRAASISLIAQALARTVLPSARKPQYQLAHLIVEGSERLPLPARRLSAKAPSPVAMIQRSLGSLPAAGARLSSAPLAMIRASSVGQTQGCASRSSTQMDPARIKAANAHIGQRNGSATPRPDATPKHLDEADLGNQLHLPTADYCGPCQV